MVRTASAAAALVFAASLGSAALAQEPQAAQALAPKTPAAEAAIPAPVAAPVAVPMAAPAAPSLSQSMQAQAAVDAPPAPPPPPAPLAAPSIAVTAESLAPAAKPAPKIAFAAPPASIAPTPAAPIVVAVATPVAAQAPQTAPVPQAAPVPQTAPVAQAEPAVTKVAVSAPVPAPVVAPTPVVVPAPPRAPTPSASAVVARRVTDAAGAFDAWTEKAGRIDGKFADASGVSAALVDTSAFQAQQLEEGAVAFGALVALQDPVFVQSAHELASTGDHAAAAAILLKDPSQVMVLPGSDTAAAFAAQSLAKRAQAVITAGKSVRQAAYSMQVDPWAKTAVPTPDKRLAEAKARSSTAIALDGPASELLMKRLVELRAGRQSVVASGRAGAPTPLVTRSLALAAMIVLGEADEAHSVGLTPLLVESKSGDCLKMAKLNLFQCLSVAGPHYEDAFCVGQHGLGEAGQCLSAATGVAAPAPAVAAPVMLAAGPPPSAGISVPIALLAEGGPERAAAYAPAPPPAPVAPIVATPAPTLQLAQAAPARPENQPGWAREAAPQPRVYAQRDPQDEEAAPAPAAPRLDRGMAYRWDRQQRATDYAAPGYAPQPYGYAEPRQGYGQYAQPARRQAQPNAYDPRYDEEDDDAPPVDPRTLAPQRGYWGYR